jgi:hypothetical protein
MTSHRAQAYGRVIAAISDIGPTKLSAREQELVREAADALFFCEDVTADAAAREALAAVRGLAEHLVETDRWIAATAERLVADVVACGPLLPARL